jgi:Protein of unknown function (DUF2846)
MAGACRAVVALFMAFALAACATVDTTPLESQSKQKDSRLARLYFIWPKSMMFRTGTVDVKVDGQVVAHIAPDSYMFVDRAPGTYTLKVEPPFDWAYFETDVPVAAGRTYYYAINIKPVEMVMSGGGFVRLAHPNPGTLLPLKGGGTSLASYRLSSLDPATAAAEMAKLQPR